MKNYYELSMSDKLTKEDIKEILLETNPEVLDEIYKQSYKMKENTVGKKVYYRGIIEFSNICAKDCFYCGIRKSQESVDRFSMSEDEILEMAKWACDNNYGSVALQSGEIQSEEFTQRVESVLCKIKELSDGKLGVTLSLGEQSRETYERWYKAGGHRYLLRIETTNPELYAKMHPSDSLHSWHTRVECLKNLRDIGYQVGTGVMIGLPFQTLDDLVADIQFFKDMDIDMIGMGPYVYSQDTPFAKFYENTKENRDKAFELGLKMIAAGRLYLKDINIAATTALQALHPLGREKGLKAGANILMPIITLQQYRSKYQLYDNKPCIDDTPEHCKACLSGRIKSVGD
ncbi:MAG: [FeFe] hydrogenase H-cluster radical SAM maturase HydE [Fusobacteria bacterium]|nr:[FeFe] hydrogenase H-cluster radical SAM maturase HydE [Fusobacteriota bacterium]